jgi:hypothetical protein
VAEGLDMFRVGTSVTGRSMIPSHNLFFRKRILLDGYLGVDPISVGIALANGLYDVSENLYGSIH